MPCKHNKPNWDLEYSAKQRKLRCFYSRSPGHSQVKGHTIMKNEFNIPRLLRSDTGKEMFALHEFDRSPTPSCMPCVILSPNPFSRHKELSENAQLSKTPKCQHEDKTSCTKTMKIMQRKGKAVPVISSFVTRVPAALQQESKQKLCLEKRTWLETWLCTPAHYLGSLYACYLQK